MSRPHPEAPSGHPDPPAPSDDEGTFEVRVEGTVAAGADTVWATLFSPGSRAAWAHGPSAAGPGGPSFGPGVEGGSIQVVEPRRHVRLTWHPEGWPRPTTIHVRVAAEGEGSLVTFRQERLPGSRAREARRSVLQEALDAIRHRLGAS